MTHAALIIGSGTLMESIRCSGTERLLVECSVQSIPVGECSHNEDAGVICCKTHYYDISDKPNVIIINL